MNTVRHKRVRVSRACQSCRKRKISCSGTYPCTKCQADNITCDFNNVDGRRTKRARLNDEDLSTGSPDNASLRQLTVPASPYEEDDQHIGSSSGLAFLQQAVQSTSSAGEYRNLRATSPLEGHPTKKTVPDSNSIFSSEDIHGAKIDFASSNLDLPNQEESDVLLQRYFEFATPTYRFFHKQTVEKWAKAFIRSQSFDNQEKSLSTTKKAALFMIWAQALTYGNFENQNGMKRRNLYYEKAKFLIDSERGQPKLESCQARLTMCLYLVSTFRLNECWYRFGMTALIIQALGLHIKKPSMVLDLAELECRKRVFWSAYILDRYLSVMKGRPRVFRDEDINQEYPANVCDDDLVSTDRTMISMLPPYGMLEAQICHAKLACIIGETTDLLYSLNPPDKDELLSRAEILTQKLKEWEYELPAFLKPTPNVLVGARIFERQNTVIKFSHAHVRILVTRQFLLEDFTTLGQGSSAIDPPSQKFVHDCIEATLVIIDAVETLINNKCLIDGFWFYQYVALCAISTFYIYIIHRRLDVSALVSEQQNGRPYLDIVDHCQKYLVSLVPKGSSNHKHHLLLAKLRRNAHKIAHRNSNHLPAQENNNLELVDSATTPSLPAVDLELQNHRQEDRSVSNHIVSPDAQAHRPLVGRDGEFCEGSVNRFSNSLVENYLPMAGMNGVDVDHNEVLNHNSNMAVPEFNFDDLNMSWGFIDQCVLAENLETQNLDYFSF